MVCKEGLLDIRVDAVPDFYLVLAGPQTRVLYSRGENRPWLIDFAYLFEAPQLIAGLQRKKLKLGVATSVSNDLWHGAEIFPNASNPMLLLNSDQFSMLSLFSSIQCAG